MPILLQHPPNVFPPTIMRRMWYYLDPLNQPRGPITDSQLANMLRHSDYFVWTNGMSEWVMASELFARPGVAPLRGEQPNRNHDGQVPSWINAARRADRDIHELLGLIRGVLIDGVVSETEVLALDRWLNARPDARTTWPANILSARIGTILSDGRIDPEESADLKLLLESVTGDQPDAIDAPILATRVPIDDPEPTITFPDRTFVFTGQFVWGTRSKCESAVIERGGLVGTGITRKTHYVVIGIEASRDWIHSTHGRKIEKAVEYRATGIPLAIISEEHWVRHVAC